MASYEEAVKYIEEIPRFATKNTVEDTGRMLSLLTGNSLNSKIIHVAGTNGKGSVCAYLRAILMEGKRSVGMFISPHLESMRERISINGELITKEEFVRIFTLVRKMADECGKYDLSHPSYFEFLFLMAMCYFGEKQPDYILLETGLGGRLDATNSILTPAVCV
ncbi:MAG: bifunctional folylpolyglutamate synthase/dihydrofolate synthase, partial [Lachnospiraceae bacterium]|nr:bifunctional folylpolyglutamate synthase/dihydrofolate synthase [Lachnospiraceae bacterium]